MPKVLVADDSMAVRKVAERHLRQAGLDVTLAASGEEAVALLAHERPDLIVCDVIMPDKSGYDVCTFARSHATLAGTPVLLISGIVNADVTRQAESCGANGVLKKPFQGTTLQDRVLELLGHRNGDEQTEAASPPAPEPPPPRAATGRDDAELTALRERVETLEAALASERDAAARVTDQLNEATRAAQRVEELEGLLEQERANAVQASRRLAEVEQAAGRAEELERLLAREREEAVQLTERLAAAEQEAGRVEELETLLASERERTAQLHEEIAEAKQRAAEAAARYEEAARKLAQIASLSQ